MPTKYKNEENQEGTLVDPLQPASKDVEVETAPLPVLVKEKKVLYKRVIWKHVKEVFQCVACDACRDEVDDIILHVILHYPKAEQETIFNQLIKEK